jgi:3-deoxy-D-manno-octulosonate 8-phosphate phosphatase (KDO 8-P phosphatase)
LPTKRPTRSALRRIRLLLLDVDGVMTDGGLYYSGKGELFKKFNVKDGYGIIKLRNYGIPIGIITGRVSDIIVRRAKELGIKELHQNLHDKLSAYDRIKKKFGLKDAEIAYIGDDEPDLPVLKRTGFSAAPSDAMPAVRKTVDYVCRCAGGQGAVREVIDMIMDAQSQD